MKKPLGCVSLSGLITASLVLLIIIGFITIGGGTIFSPGALNAQAGEQSLGNANSHDDLSHRCEACHAPFWGREIMSDRCLVCHTKVTVELKIPSSLHGALTERGFLPCQQCHTDHKGAAALLTIIDQQRFPHSNFPLVGAHVQVECQACHINNVFKGTPQPCFACHQKDDAHQGQFGLECAQCHVADSWKAVTFDHNRTAFPLVGAHVQVECQACHINNVFKGTPQLCFACHQKDDVHQGQFGLECAGCHTVNAWTPAGFNGPHPFPMDHGADSASSCQTCHPTNLQNYTCYGCHEHTPANIEGEHREEGISDFQDCMRCHPTGREEEGEDD